MGILSGAGAGLLASEANAEAQRRDIEANIAARQRARAESEALHNLRSQQEQREVYRRQQGTYQPNIGADIGEATGMPAAGVGAASSPEQEAARARQVRVKQPEYANQSEAETRRLTRNPEVPQVVDKGNLRLRTPGSWAPLPMNQAQRLEEMRRLNPVAPQADQTPVEEARLARNAPVGQTSLGAPQAGSFIDRIRMAESGGNPNAVGPYIPGQGTAKGEMQVMDKTNADPGFGVTPARDNSPAERARVGRDYAQALLARYGNEADAAAAYNWGPGNFDRWVASGRNPAQMPAETRAYVAKVAGGQPQVTAQAPAQPGAQPQAAAAPQPQYNLPQLAPIDDQKFAFAQSQLARIDSLMQATRDVGQLQTLQSARDTLVGQLQGMAVDRAFYSAQAGDDRALGGLASFLRIPVGRLPDGRFVVNVGGQQQAMTRQDLFNGLYSRYVELQRGSQFAAEDRKFQQAVELEKLKGLNAQQLEALKQDYVIAGKITEAQAEAMIKAGQVQGSRTLDDGRTTIVFNDGRSVVVERVTDKTGTRWVSTPAIPS